MAAPTIINKFGKVIGWNSVTFNILGRDVEGITEMEYDDEVEIEGVRGAGKHMIGYGEGNYTAKVSITLMEEERRAILAALPQGVRLQELAPVDAQVSYEYADKVYRDTIKNIVFMNNGIAVKQADKTVAFKFDCFCTHIEWNK